MVLFIGINTNTKIKIKVKVKVRFNLALIIIIKLISRMQKIDLILIIAAILNSILSLYLITTTPLTLINRARFLHFLIENILLFLALLAHILKSHPIPAIKIADSILIKLFQLTCVLGFIAVHVYAWVIGSLEIVQNEGRYRVGIGICVGWYYVVSLFWLAMEISALWQICKLRRLRIRVEKQAEMRYIRDYVIQEIQYQCDGQASCTICLLDFQQGQLIYKLTCKHIFHKNCLKKWLKQRITCPNCRQYLVRNIQPEQ